MNILEPLLRTIKKRFVVVMTDGYSKQAEAIPMKTTTAPQVATIIMKDCIMAYGLPEYLLTDSLPQCVTDSFFVPLLTYGY